VTDIIASDCERILSRTDLAELRGKSVLLAGASGLVGGYFLASLQRFSARAGGVDVAVVMRDAPTHLAPYMDGVRVLRGDLSDDEFCRCLPSADVVIHCAGYAQPARFMADPVETLRLNTTTTFALLERLRPGGKFLFVSSSEVYSGLADPPYKESDIGAINTTHPRACYIEGKRCGETIVAAYRATGVAAKSARLSLAYGPGTRAGDARVINSFIEKARAGKIALLDRGEANRTYCYISDAVEIMWNILLRGREPVYNVGGRSRITIGDLARKIGKAFGVPVIFPEVPRSVAGAPDDVFLDMTKAHAEFGPREYVSLDEGLAWTIAWQKTELKGGVDD
jgi:nucleoside-diphosphate-sugar epimerase